MAKNGNNEGSVYKDKQGRWRGQVRVPSTDGTVKRKYFYGRTRKEVVEKVDALLQEIRTDSYIEPCKTTLYEWLCIWYDTYCNDIRMTTKVNYQTYIHRHIKDSIGRYKLCELNTLLLQTFYNEKAKNGKLNGSGGLNAKTLKNMHQMVRKALKQAMFLGMIQKNPGDLIVLPKRKKVEMRYFLPEDQKRLQEAIKGDKLEMLILLDLYTGLRQGELLGLYWENVHIELNGQSYLKVVQTLNRIKNPDETAPTKTILTINEPKTANSVRTIPLLPEIAQRLAVYHEQQTTFLRSIGLPPAKFVFTSSTGSPVEPRDFQRDYKKILIDNDLPMINVHGLRHTFATRSLESGMSVKTLSKILGHASVGFTLDVYAHVTEQLKIEEMEKLNVFL
ncbi:MAG: site-specific integrase [Oscillospiraceae bacterium]|nr:site-specific integrase [Oscillospiraceae bacterium]